MIFKLPGKKYLAILVTLVAGIALSIALFSFVERLQKKHFEYEFDLKASDRTEVIADSFDDHIDLLYYITGLFDSSQKVERGEFYVFTKNILLLHPDILALAWVPRVKELELLSYEVSAYRDGILDFAIKALDGQSQILKSETKQEYFPVYYVEPYKENRDILGLDLSSDPARWQAMQKACDSGLPIATGKINLVRDIGNSQTGTGIRIFVPVYRKDAATGSPAERRSNLIGFLSILFRASDTIEIRLKNLNPIGVDVYLLDKTSGSGADRLYFHPSRTRRENIRPLEETELKHERLLWVKDLDIAGRKWSLVCVPAPAFFSRYYEIWQPWAALAGGLFLTLLFSYYIFAAVNRAAKIQRLVDERTAELRENEEELRKLSRAIEQSPSVAVITDTKGNIEYVNPKFTQLTGYTAQEVIGKNPRILKSGEMPPQEYRHLWETIISGKEWQGELHNRKKNGQLYWEFASISAIRSPQGVAEHYLKVSEDITERKRLENLKDEFVSNVSHELRTPLSIIKEAINLILDKIVGEVNQKQENVLVTAKDNIDRLTRIINELLDISKIEAGKLQLNKDNVDIVSLIKKTVLSFEAKVKDKGLELKQNFSPAEIPLLIDADKITEVFVNLLGNAVKFTDKGYIEISAEDKGNEVECFVKDTGIGIAQENLPKVFDKFQQFGRVSGPGERGTGLGLSIVRGIIEMHNGNIRVESRLGEGTKFTFILPKAAAGIPEGKIL
jgi:PAS domain S-box-containing protein